MADLSAWDEIQLDSVSAPPEDFAAVTTAEGAEIIRAWFLDNFEVPAPSTPEDSSIYYIWGGPYDATDIIESVFDRTASEEIRTVAVELVRATGIYDWAPNRRRIQLPCEMTTPNAASSGASAPLSPEQSLANLHNLIAELEETLAGLRLAGPGIGHNNPPDAIEDGPLTTQDIGTIEQTLAALKELPADPEDVTLVLTAQAMLGNYAATIKSYLAAHADLIATTGKWTAFMILIGTAGEHIGNIVEVLKSWMVSILTF